LQQCQQSRARTSVAENAASVVTEIRAGSATVIEVVAIETTAGDLVVTEDDLAVMVPVDLIQ